MWQQAEPHAVSCLAGHQARGMQQGRRGCGKGTSRDRPLYALCALLCLLCLLCRNFEITPLEDNKEGG